jgi:RNA polymerase sigma factor (sigma-70 family)
MIATRTESTDCQLVAATRDGDDAAFEELYSRYRPRIASFVCGMVRDEGRAEDLTQEVFLSALRRLRETDSEINFKPWVYRIARNQAIDHHRRTSRAEEISMDADFGLRPSDHQRLVEAVAPDRALVARERLDHLCGAFDELSDVQARVIVLRELEGRSYREIAEQVGITRGAVEAALFRARRRLESEYEQLAEGRRCAGMRTTIARLAEGVGTATDEGRLARHARRCSLCRRRAREMGVEPLTTLARVRSKVAALLPLPWGVQGGGGPLAGMLGERAAALAAIAAIGAGGAAVGVEKLDGGSDRPPQSSEPAVERRAEPPAAPAPRPSARPAPTQPRREPAGRSQRRPNRSAGRVPPAESRFQQAPVPAPSPAPAAPAAPAQPSGGGGAEGSPAHAPKLPQAPAPKLPEPPAPVRDAVESLPLPEVQVPPVQLPAPPPGAPGSGLVGGVNRTLDGVTGTLNRALP